MANWIEEYVESEECSELVAKMGCIGDRDGFGLGLDLKGSDQIGQS